MTVVQEVPMIQALILLLLAIIRAMRRWWPLPCRLDHMRPVSLWGASG